MLDASNQDLANDAASRFATARFAETASVSVDSLYQYFGANAAIRVAR